jgi:hypothetical protein
MSMIFDQLAAVHLGDEARTSQIRHRYLALLLDAMRLTSAEPLPGPAPGVEEINEHWTGR